ncbi:MAG: hypothetical protein LBG87_05520 [Spirochaetaceae bacterium]|jgi:hypothetical protein|nr:hypothetical protein [Spirochaetaceae bacterium]
MFWNFAKKWLRYAVAAYLGLAAMSVFAFSAIDASFPDAASAEAPLFLTAGDLYFDCLAVSPAKDAGFARQSLPRMSLPQILIIACAGLVCASVKAVTKTIPKKSKTLILLKLRI